MNIRALLSSDYMHEKFKVSFLFPSLLFLGQFMPGNYGSGASNQWYGASKAEKKFTNWEELFGQLSAPLNTLIMYNSL